MCTIHSNYHWCIVYTHTREAKQRKAKPNKTHRAHYGILVAGQFFSNGKILISAAPCCFNGIRNKYLRCVCFMDTIVAFVFHRHKHTSLSLPKRSNSIHNSHTYIIYLRHFLFDIVCRKICTMYKYIYIYLFMFCSIQFSTFLYLLALTFAYIYIYLRTNCFSLFYAIAFVHCVYVFHFLAMVYYVCHCWPACLPACVRVRV